MKRTTGFQAIRSEGGLLPPDLLRRVFDPREKLPGTLREDYGLPKGERLNEVITQSWNRLRKHWAEFRTALGANGELRIANGGRQSESSDHSTRHSPFATYHSPFAGHRRRPYWSHQREVDASRAARAGLRSSAQKCRPRAGRSQLCDQPLCKGNPCAAANQPRYPFGHGHSRARSKSTSRNASSTCATASR